MDNVVTYVYAKFCDDRLWNEKALADRKSDNNTNNKNNKNTTLLAIGEPFSRGEATGVDIGIYTPKISPSKLFVG